MSGHYIPDGYHTITPYLIVEDAQGLIEFIEKSFDGKLIFKMEESERITHAEMKIGNSMLMLAQSSKEYKPTLTTLYLYVEDTDAVYQKALEAGATSVSEPVNKFYGDRNAGVKDQFGNSWGIATHIENVSEEELEKRAGTTN